MTKRKLKPETEIRRIRRPIDDERRSQLAYEMAHVTKELDRERDEKASEMKIFNEHIKELGQRLSRLANDVEEGQEDRDIECVVVRDFGHNAVFYYDVETYKGEGAELAADSRAMEAEEREKLEQVTIEDVTGEDDA